VFPDSDSGKTAIQKQKPDTTDTRQAFAGTWKLIDSQNIDDYERKTGILNRQWRKTSRKDETPTPTLTIAVKGARWMMDSHDVETSEVSMA